MSVKSDVLDYLDDHPDYPDPDEQHAEVADRLIDDGVTDGARRTVRRWVGRWREEHGSHGESGKADKVSGDTPDHSHGLDLLERDYHYNSADDVYVLFVDHRPENLVIPGEKARALKEAYSNWTGDESTINEICRQYGINRTDFVAIKREFGWTHDSAPQTDEELVDRPIDAQVEDLARQRERELEQKWQKRQWRETEKDAQRWRQFGREIVQPMMDGLADVPKRTGRAFEPSRKSEPVAASFFETDRHLDGRSLEGSFEEHKETWLSCFQRALSRVVAFKRPEVVYLVQGSDLFNVDTHEGTTTNGTPQGQTLGPRESVRRVAEASVEIVEMLRDVAPVRLRVIPGNHDRRTSRAYLWGLEQRYADCDDVQVRGDCGPYQYEKYGDNLIGWHHGDGIGGGEARKEANLTSKMVSDVPDLVGDTSYRYWFVGHEHRMWADEGASLVEMAPTTKAPDEWEDYKGYPEGHRGSVGWVFEKSGGQSARFMGLVDQGAA